MTLTPIRLGERLWRLGCHHMNLYLIRGEGGAALFEVGVSATVPLVLAQLDALGLPRAEVRWLILSHAHSDHSAGQAGLLAGLPRARLLLSSGSRQILSRSSTLARFSGDDSHMGREICRREGLAGGEWPPLAPPPRGRSEVVSAGDILDLAGVRLELLGAGGHAPRGLAAWLPDDGALLASDAAGFFQGGGPGFPLYFVSYGDYLEGLARMASLKPAVLGLGHQAHFQGPEVGRYLGRTAEHLQGYHRQIGQRFRRGQRAPEISDWLFSIFYRDELSIYTPANIKYCCDLLVKRSWPAAGRIA